MSKEEYNPKILGFLCNWCCYAAADAAGVSRYQYPPNLRTIRVMLIPPLSSGVLWKERTVSSPAADNWANVITRLVITMQWE